MKSPGRNLREGGHLMILLILLILLILSLSPFFRKPPVIDEESYLFISEKVREIPLRPYDWWRAWQPYFGRRTADFFIYAHPPLFPYLLSFIKGHLGMITVPGLRLALLPFSLILLISFFSLARKATRDPVYPSLLLVFCPTLHLTLQNSLMIDLPYTVITLLSMLLLNSGLMEDGGRRKVRFYALSGLFLGIASLTKYPALILFPLLILVPLLRGGKEELRYALSGIRIFLFVFLLWCAHNLLFYGRIHIAFVLQNAGEIMRSPLLSRLSGVMVQLGLFPFLLLVLAVAPVERVGRILLIISFSASTLFILLHHYFQGYTPLEKAMLIALATGGLWSFLRYALLPLAFISRDLVKRCKGEPVPGEGFLQEYLLPLWFLSILFSVILFHNFASTRYLAPLVPPLILLLSRRLESIYKRGARRVIMSIILFTSAPFTLLIGFADLDFARSYSEFSSKLEERYGSWKGAIWFTGEWGMRYFMEREGHIFYTEYENPGEGDLIVIPVEAVPAGVEGVRGRLSLIDTFTVTDGFPIRTMNMKAKAGYYSELSGFLPFTISKEPLEIFRVYRVEYGEERNGAHVAR